MAAGAKLAVAVSLLILLIAVIELLLGRPIAHFGSLALSVAYVLVVYLPVIAVCVLAYLRLKGL